MEQEQIDKFVDEIIPRIKYKPKYLALHEAKAEKIRLLRYICENYGLKREEKKLLKDIALDLVVRSKLNEAQSLLKIIYKGNW